MLDIYRNGQLLPIIKAAENNIEWRPWITNNKDQLQKNLMQYGMLLFRHFSLTNVDDFHDFMAIFSSQSHSYEHGSTPRTQITERVFTSTEYPSDQIIPFHSEMSYTNSWPMKLWFYCAQPAKQGGMTPLADNRRVLASLPSTIVEKFKKLGVKYVRNFHDEHLGVSWQSTFQTDSPQQVESYCQQQGIRCIWFGKRLRTEQICQGVSIHPVSHEEVWFNQAHLFHYSSLEPEIRDFLLNDFGEDYMPRNAYYGNGEPIESEVLDTIRACFNKHRIEFEWCPYDVLMLDNMLVAHARDSFTGPRKIYVGMADGFNTRSR